MKPRMHAWLVLSATLVARPASGAIMQLLSEERSIHAKAVVACSDSLEDTRAPAVPFGDFDERVALQTNICDDSFVLSVADQYSTMTGDTLWVETSVGEIGSSGGHLAMEANSDINIWFRIPPGQQCRGISQISYDSDNRGAGYVIFNAKFQKVTPTRTVTIDSVALRHETFGIVGDTLYRDQTLKAGDYVLDLHLLAGPTRTGGRRRPPGVRRSGAVGPHARRSGDLDAREEPL